MKHAHFEAIQSNNINIFNDRKIGIIKCMHTAP